MLRATLLTTVTNTFAFAFAFDEKRGLTNMHSGNK